MSLIDQIDRIRGAIAAGQIVNEAAVGTGIVLPILHELGWPVFDPQIVAPEYTLEGRRVDYALCSPRTKPAAFVELKQPGKSEGGDRQLFEYAFHAGVPIAVLTDGREWHFYLPSGQGAYQERRVYRLDIVERESKESAERLNRYLSYAAVCSGSARKAALDDYDGVRREREVTATIPQAWRKLLMDQDSLLVDLIADQVESLCGFKPDPDAVGQFLLDQVRADHVFNAYGRQTSRPCYDETANHNCNCSGWRLSWICSAWSSDIYADRDRHARAVSARDSTT